MHIFEYAKSGRSSCRGPKNTCPVTDRSIRQGELRLGVEVESPRSLLFWRHWCCTTPKVIENMQAAYSEPSEIQGWDTLREDDQERIQRAWENGRIPENELPQPAAEHIDPKAKKQGNVDLPPTNKIATERQKEPQKNTKANKKDNHEEAKDKKATPAKRNAQKIKEKQQSSTKKGEENTEVKLSDGEGNQDTIIKKSKKTPKEPKVASYASRKNTSQNTSKEPTRRSSRVAASKKEEPAPKRKSENSERKSKKAKAV